MEPKKVVVSKFGISFFFRGGKNFQVNHVQLWEGIFCLGLAVRWGHLELLWGWSFATHQSGKLSSGSRRVRSMGGDALMEMQIGAVGEGVGEGYFTNTMVSVCFSLWKKEGGGYISSTFVRNRWIVRFWFDRDVLRFCKDIFFWTSWKPWEVLISCWFLGFLSGSWHVLSLPMKYFVSGRPENPSFQWETRLITPGL